MIRYNLTYNFISVLLLVLVLFQSCTVYYKQNFTPEEVVKSQKKMRLIDRNGEKYPFYKLIEENGDYYVLAKDSFFFTNKFRDREKIDLDIPKFSAYQIDPKDYEILQVKNSSASGWLTATSVIVIVGALLWIYLDSYSANLFL